jgi:PadR family transcriptional regulator AphA
MSLEFAILGFLNYRPYTSYDLKKIFDTTIRHFWLANQIQIYRTLARLTEQGYTGMEKVSQDVRPDRKVYSIADAGLAKLRKLLAAPPSLEGTRSAGLSQVFFAGQLPDEDLLAKFKGFVAIVRASLAQWDRIPGQLEPFQEDVNSTREHFFWILTLDNGIRAARATLEWAESIIEKIKSGQVLDM